MTNEDILGDIDEGNYTVNDYVDIFDCPWPDPRPTGIYCPPIKDRFQCWKATPANTTAYGPCPLNLGANSSVHLAHRTCLPNGEWERGNWTNYSRCISYYGDPDQEIDPLKDREIEVELAKVLIDVYYAGSIISLTFLIITLFIFCYFRSLQCSRIFIHKNLVVAFIFRFILIIIMFEPFVSKRQNTYRDVDWLCKVFVALRYYSVVATFSWMLVEGIFLHNRLVVSVFRSDAPFKLFYFIGWVIPAIITATWAVLTHFYYDEKCWNDSSKSPFIFIIFAPILIALVINLAFLINIIRVLITKLRAHNTIESRRIRKAIKATVVLFPLLGITNCLFLAKPSENKSVLMAIYRVTNAILPSCQGIFVTVLYCFMNTEVQSVIRKKWNRFRINRAMNSRTRRRSSRTSSFFLSQSESQSTPINKHLQVHSFRTGKSLTSISNC